MSDKLWGGRFSESTDARVEAMNASIDVDRRLYREDIAGSIAHCTMLSEQGIIGADDASAIIDGLRAILGDIEEGTFEFRVDREDVHMNIEAALRDRIGAAAGRLHTARSRNDQVALDVRLWLRRSVATLLERLEALRDALAEKALEHADTLMPGYTHLQRAQPVTFGHTLLAYEAMLARDHERLASAFTRVDRLPLGAGALAGTPFPIDRQRVATLLGFARLCHNSQDAVASRDHAVEVVFACAMSMTHLSRFAEELVLWSSQEFGFVTLPDAFCTGSSIMPQKKNPDIPELVRGQSARVVGDLVGLLGMLKGLPLAYNKDLQEDKEPLFHAVDTLETALAVLAPLVSGLRPNADRMQSALERGHLTATDLADALVEGGLPFRDAHRVVGELVGEAERRGVTLAQLPEELVARSVPSEIPYLEVLSARRSVDRRDVPGAPAPHRVRAAAESARALVRDDAARRAELTAGLTALNALVSPTTPQNP